ncbi:alpha/beta hydrolase [Actinomyces bowdenii]|uniref:alpha/beta hydrolase n=1 Tax=Actinomyces bowdenii TaxID=131109 RepID=UPI001ABCB3A2|nr:alpha/beta hydrolase [Actinomyces bowdenii]MBO3725062.1 alpha/beta hydrolase [Actinomyces bowdenii]
MKRLPASDWDAQSAAERIDHPFFGGASNAMEAYCRGWEPGRRPRPRRSAPRAQTRFIGAAEDARTLYPWAQSLADQLDNGHLLTVAGYGHGASGSCAGAAMIDFLINGTIPAEGAICTTSSLPTFDNLHEIVLLRAWKTPISCKLSKVGVSGASGRSLPRS